MTGSVSETPAPNISVVVVTYNYGRYLARALDSIVAQGADHEIIVVDDGSEDATRAIVERYAPRVRYIHQEHAGTFTGSRTGYRAAGGDWIMYVDADDRLRPGALAALSAAATRNPQARLIVGRTCTIGEDGHETVYGHLPLGRDPLDNFARFARGQFHVSVAGGLIHRSLLAPFDREPFDYPHSMDLVILAYGLLRGIERIDDITLDVFQHESRLRDDILSIHRSGLKLVDVLFDPKVLPAAAMRYRGEFIARIELERTRSYHRAGWHSLAWRSYVRAVAASPRAIASTRNLRRAAVSGFLTLLRAYEGPIERADGHWFHGNHRQIWSDGIAFLEDCARRRAPAIRLQLRRKTFLLMKPDDATHVLVANASNYAKTGILRDDPILANGMIGMQSPEHAEHRKIFASRMQRQAIGALAPMIAEVVERHSRHLDRNDPVDVSQTTKSMCSEIASRFVFGCYNQTRTDQLLELLREAHHYSMRESRAWIRWPQWMPLSRRKYRARAEQKLDQWLAPIVAERLKEPGDNLLSIILRARGSEAVTAQALRGPILMLFLASFEPVSVTLSWALQLLAAHPQVQDRVADEAAGVLKGRPPADEDLPRLPYLQDVIKEVQRLYPNEWLITRRVLGSDRLPSGVLVRRGQEVMISPYLLGRDGRYFPDPSRFDPSRFTGTPTWPRAAYIPFGTGPRVCLGESFAKLQMAIALAAFLQRWRIEPVAGEPPRPATANLFSAYVQGGRLNLRFRARENHAAATKSLGR